MKRIKKLASLLLAMVMVLAMSVTTFAAEPELDPNADPAPTKKEHEYQIFQIFTGDYVKDESGNQTLSNVKWGKNSTQTPGGEVDKEILDKLQGLKNDGDATPDNYVPNSASDTAQLNVIKSYVNLNSEAYSTAFTEENGQVTFKDLVPGYYLIKDAADLSGEENESYTLYVVRVVDTTLTFTPKVGVPTSDKKIVETDENGNTTLVDANNASIGEDVNYQITGTLPTNFASYKSYYYVFTDTLSAGLDYKADSVKVFVGKGEDLKTYTDVTEQFYKGSTSNSDGKTTITIGVRDLKKLTGVNLDSETKIIVQYSATLNENAVIAGAGNPNDVDLTYSNDPNQDADGRPNDPEEPPTPVHPTGVTPKKEVKTFTTELEITKVDENQQVLQGAEFTLTGEGVKVVLVTEAQFTANANGEYWKLKDGTYTKTAPTVGGAADNTADYESTEAKYAITTALKVAKGEGKDVVKVSGIVDENGIVKFTGLGAGVYWLEETKTPPGYNTLGKFQFEIKADPTADGKGITFSVPADSIKDGEKPGEGNVVDDITISNGSIENTFASKIVNQSGTLLPSTGGIGTTIFYVVGGILVVAAGILLVTKKRMSAR